MNVIVLLILNTTNPRILMIGKLLEVNVKTYLNVLPELPGLNNITCVNTSRIVTITSTLMSTSINVCTTPVIVKLKECLTFMVAVYQNVLNGTYKLMT